VLNASYIMETNFSAGRSQSTQIEPLTMGTQLVSMITYVIFCMYIITLQVYY
jgi:hypothetical protein